MVKRKSLSPDIHALETKVVSIHEQLQGSRFFFEAVGDGLGAFSFQIGQESFDHNVGVSSCFGAREVVEKGGQKSVESRTHSGGVLFGQSSHPSQFGIFAFGTGLS